MKDTIEGTYHSLLRTEGFVRAETIARKRDIPLLWTSRSAAHSKNIEVVLNR